MQKSAYSKKVFIHSKKWTLAEVLAFAMLGWTYNLLPKSELAGLLLVPSGRWSHNLYVEGQCDIEGDCGMCDAGVELLGGISFHEFSSQPKEKSPRALSCFSHVCICWFSHNCH